MEREKRRRAAGIACCCTTVNLCAAPPLLLVHQYLNRLDPLDWQGNLLSLQAYLMTQAQPQRSSSA